jgi:hypothetical protein
MDIVYYHGGCPDGWCAAYIAKMKYPKAELVPLSYGAFNFGSLLIQVTGKEVLMVDFSLKSREENDELALASKSLLILDHHKTAQEIIGDAPYAKFDMSRSGAGLAWDYLFGKDSVLAKSYDDVGMLNYEPRFVHNLSYYQVKRPWWVDYTEDQDLWRFKLPNSREVNAYLNVQARTVEGWTQMLQFLSIGLEDSLIQVVRLGGAIRQHIDLVVKAGLKNLNPGVWYTQGHFYTVGVVNNGYIGISEIGEAVYNANYDIALVWHEDGEGSVRFGLRSKVADVGAIAKSFPGGGGHKASAGFELTTESGRMLIDRILGRDKYGPTSRCC